MDQADQEGIAPLMLAIEQDDLRSLSILLAHGANPAPPCPKPIHSSWSRALWQPGGVKLANALLDAVGDPRTLPRDGCPEGEETVYLWTALFHLNRKGTGALAQRLIDSGFDANERLPNGLTPLLIAAHKETPRRLRSSRF